MRRPPAGLPVYEPDIYSVDAIANPNANELARKAADDFARGFTCGKDAVKIIGTSGRAVELATMR